MRLPLIRPHRRLSSWTLKLTVSRPVEDMETVGLCGKGCDSVTNVDRPLNSTVQQQSVTSIRSVFIRNDVLKPVVAYVQHWTEYSDCRSESVIKITS